MRTPSLCRACSLPRSGGSATSEEGALQAVTDQDFNPRQVAIVEEDVAGVPRSGNGPQTEPGTARLLSYGDEEVEVEVRVKARALLVLTDTSFPGWRATVDGEFASVHRVDYLLRGVAVKPGRHRVEFRYQPASWRIGWLVSGATALALLAWLIASGQTRRSRSSRT